MMNVRCTERVAEVGLGLVIMEMRLLLLLLERNKASVLYTHTIR